MSYYSGSATSITALRQAVIDACTSEGWSWDSGNNVLSKSALFVRLIVTATELQLLGRTAPLSGDAPGTVNIGRLCNSGGLPTFDFTWPATYHLFIFTNPDEVYLVVRYDVDVFQWAAFGKSAVAGLPGSGMWIGATRGDVLAVGISSSGGVATINRQSGGFSNVQGRRYISPGWGWYNQFSSPATAVQDRNTFVHSNLDDQGWLLNALLTNTNIGVTAISELLATQPSAWNSEAALMPMRAYKIRPSSRVSLVADLVHARHVRVDNYEPGQVIELGSDRWMVFPWLRKSLAARDGSTALSDAGSINHSGTFGWAIRYEGP